MLPASILDFGCSAVAELPQNERLVGAAHACREDVLKSRNWAYPEIEEEVAASEELVDLAAGGFDAGIRLGQFISPDMVAVRLTPPFSFVVVGSPDYLLGRRRPEHIDDLRDHACLRMRRSEWVDCALAVY